MPEIFHRLIAGTALEVSARHPEYFSCCEIRVPPVEDFAEQCRLIPSLQRFSHREVASALTSGVQSLKRLQLPIRPQSAVQTDAISMTLMRGILDAYLAARGFIPLKYQPVDAEFQDGVLERLCWSRETRHGVPYLISKRAGTPLLIVSTTGAPLGIWASLLKDDEISRRHLIVKSRAADLISGGMPQQASVLEDVADIADVLDAEQLTAVDVLAWCNGARVATLLARDVPGRIRSLILLSPTFRGSTDAGKFPSPFEESLWTLHTSLTENPRIAPYLLRTVVERPPLDLSGPRANPAKDADDVLRLPPYAHRSLLLAPLANLEFFNNYMARVANDEAIDFREVVARLSCPITMVAGTHDGAINVESSRVLLAAYGKNVSQVTIYGAGHHIHLLQYGYLKWVLDASLSGGLPFETTRLRVEHSPLD